MGFNMGRSVGASKMRKGSKSCLHSDPCLTPPDSVSSRVWGDQPVPGQILRAERGLERPEMLMINLAVGSPRRSSYHQCVLFLR